MPGKALVVDANILVRSVLGKRVREVMEAYAEEVTFFVPEAAPAEAPRRSWARSSSRAASRVLLALLVHIKMSL